MNKNQKWPQVPKNDLDLEMTPNLLKNENIFLKNHFLTSCDKTLQLDAMKNFWCSAFYRIQKFQIV